jgi:hypothetical protein
MKYCIYDSGGQYLKTFFSVLYAALGVTSVKISRKYADSGLNYIEKSFMALAAGQYTSIREGELFEAI